jgi:hypothetical protein
MTALPCAAAVSGEAVYQKRCASCHDGGNETAPPRDTLKQLSVSRILRTLDFGVMINVAYVLNREEREAVAKYLGVDRPDLPIPPQAYCSDRSVNIGESPSPVWTGWGPDLSNTRYTTSGGITLNQVGKLKLKWAYAFEGDVSAFGAPTVLGSTLFVGSAGGAVQALSTDSGCLRWVYLEEETRAARIHAFNGFGCRPRWSGLHSSRFLGRNPLRQSGLSVLHVPRQRHCVAREGWNRGVEDLHRSRETQENREKPGQRGNLWAIWRGRVGIADAGCQTRLVIHHDG